MDIKFCGCGSPMSNYDIEKFGKCGGCRAADVAANKEERDRKEAERKEQDRLKKEQEEADKKAKLQAQKDRFNETLKHLSGKVIDYASVTEWTDAGGLEAKEVTIYLTDGTHAAFAQESFADGCMGHYDHYAYLGFEVV